MSPTQSTNVNPDGAMIEVDGRPALRFERRIGHPAERVWRALTEADDLKQWHPSPYELDPRPGGRVRYLPSEDEWQEQMPEAELTEFDPPRVLAHAWGEDQLRWELESDGDSCRLILVHVFDDRNKAARDGAGWHLCLDGLAASLADGPAREGTSIGDDGRTPVGWSALNSAYQRRFGISPEDATPVPENHPEGGESR